MRTVAQRASRIVVKVGSSILTAAGAVRPRVFTELIRQVAELSDAGRQVVVVSSGPVVSFAGRVSSPLSSELHAPTISRAAISTAAAPFRRVMVMA